MAQRTWPLAFLVLAACAGPKGESAKLRAPDPGRARVLQLYVLTPAADTANADGRPSADQSWDATLGARAEFASAADEKAAVETLRLWNARPVDLLVAFGAGPSRALGAIKLAKGEPRLTVSVDAEVPVEGAVNLRLQTKDAARLEAALCRELRPKAKDCHGLVRWELDWPRLLGRLHREFLANGSKETTRSETVDFATAYLKVVPGPGLKPSESAAFRKLSESWSLEILGR